MIGDHDPEDVYDATDPLHVRLSVLALIVKALEVDPDADRRVRRRADAVRLLRRVTEELASG